MDCGKSKAHIGSWVGCGLIATDFSFVEFRGPIFGIIIGLQILGLGVAKGIEAARAREKQNGNSR